MRRPVMAYWPRGGRVRILWHCVVRSVCGVVVWVQPVLYQFRLGLVPGGWQRMVPGPGWLAAHAVLLFDQRRF